MLGVVGWDEAAFAGAGDQGPAASGFPVMVEVHSGSSSLDHAMATDPLTDKVTGLTHWNINAVESVAYQYDGDPALYAADQFRSSDHDPLISALTSRSAVRGCCRRFVAPTTQTTSCTETTATTC